MALYASHLLSHGSGPLRQWILDLPFGLGLLRLSIGGYGNVPMPIGSWCLLPKTTRYPGIYYVFWFNLGLSYVAPWAAKSLLYGKRKVVLWGRKGK